MIRPRRKSIVQVIKDKLHELDTRLGAIEDAIDSIEEVLGIDELQANEAVAEQLGNAIGVGTTVGVGTVPTPSSPAPSRAPSSAAAPAPSNVGVGTTVGVGTVGVGTTG